MRIAWLILAHHQPHHLAALISALDTPEDRFFIHVDAKAELGGFEQLLGQRDRVVLLGRRDRHTIQWGGFSIVQATLDLIRAARTGSVPFDRFCLLSGADHPIKTPAEVRRTLDCDLEFLNIEHSMDEPEYRKRVTGYHPEDNRLLTWNSPRSRWLPIRVLRGLLLRIPRRCWSAFPLYQGSTWWALTAPCIAYIERFRSENPGYMRFFRWTACPDETFFHSILMASPFRDRISHDRSHGATPRVPSHPHEYGIHYVDWTTPGAHPAVLDLAYLGTLLGSHALFARKFDETRSAALMAALSGRIG
jgi:hypothetical protein